MWQSSSKTENLEADNGKLKFIHCIIFNKIKLLQFFLTSH